MFGGDDEDGDFLSPTGGAKLASLFGLDQEASGGNESFQYTAPKQPRKTSNPAPANQKAAPPAGAPAVLLATAVQAFRYINGQYVKQGKLGAAVLGSHATREYKLLLYMSQQKQVTAAKIHTGFVFTVQLNNYCTFYDDQRQNWSLMFESDKSASDFCKEVCLAKANSAPSLDAVVVQDLSLGEGPAVEHGDSLEVVYTGWLLQNQAFGQMFDTNQNKDKLLRLKIGAGKVIKGWEEGMLGMKKAGRRLLIIPPSLAYGAKGVPSRVPANSTLIFEAEIRRVKFSRDSGSDRASASSRDSAAPSPAPSPAPSVESLTPEAPAPAAAAASGPGRPGDPSLRSKSNSLSEQLSNPDTTKAKLISRMAKMGQPMLPFLTGVSGQPESSDSELEDTSSSRVKDRPAASSPVQIAAAAAPAAAHAHPHPHPTPASALMPLMSSVAPGSSHHAFQPYSYTHTQSAAPSQLQPISQVYPPQTAPYMAAGSGEVTSFLMTEARQHNTEIRLAVGKVADKVDQLVSKVDDLQRQGNLSMGVSSMSMETSMIMHNIQRIIQENECLKKEVFEKSSRIEEQNRKIGDLINENQRYMEQSHQLLEQRTDSLKSSSEHNQARLLQAEQDKVRLTEDLASAAARLSQLQLEASAHQQKAAELQSKLSSALQDGESHGRHVAALEAQLEELKEATERTQTQHRSEKQKRKELELRVSSLEEELQDLKADKESLERTLSERKSKWQAERRRRDEEVEELRRSSQQEVDAVRAQLRRARTSSDQAASEQLSQLQAELEEEWRARSQQAAAAAEERHRREAAELSEQRDALQEQLRQLSEKFTALKQSRDSDELRGNQTQSEELRVLQEKYSTLEQQAAAEREELERRVSELERREEDMGRSSGDAAAEVKRVMNGVFHSLRGEFDLGETYSGQAVLAVIVSTIKNVTLQLLSNADRPAVPPREEEKEEEEESSEQVKEKEEKPHLNGERETEAEEDERRNESQQVREDQEGEEEEALQKKKEVEEAQTEAEVKTPHLTEAPQSVGPDPDPAAELQPPETEAEPAEVQQEVQHSAPAQERDASESAQDAHEGCRPEDGRETESERVEERREEAERAGDTPEAPQKAFGPPANPPPPPSAAQRSEDQRSSPMEENGEEPFFQNASPANPPSAPTEEEEEDEMSLKGRPPPTPLFGDDEDEDDLDWLN